MLRRRIHSLLEASGLMRKLGAYAALVLIVPGGTLIALFLWAFQRGWPTQRAWRVAVVIAAMGTGLIVPG